ncbi:MAG TPA: group 1 truncated hemoglobin [Terriglobia bacterium]|nr:group 1 truncated hemoglobin [Terriglobia bacterium]
MTTSTQNSGQSLYERLGGYDTIAAIVDDFLGRMRADPAFIRFSGRGLDSVRRARQLLVDQMCALAGGPCLYTGRDMKTTHGGLGITAPEWEVSLGHAAAALDQCKVPAREKEDFIALFERYRAEIVEG